MNIDSIDSIVHLLKSISVWGVLFIILFVLPIYIAAWSGVIKLIGLTLTNKRKFFLIVLVSFSIAMVLLKIGVSIDQKKSLRAERIKQYMISYGFRAYRFKDLIQNADPKASEDDLKEIASRFPGDFTITYFDDGSVQSKGLLLTSEESLRKVNKVNEGVVPVAYEVLRNYIPKDSWMSMDTIFLKIDERFNSDLIDMLVTRCPNEFTLVFAVEKNRFYLKRVN